ncbi:unnamed protein product [Symbiodinium natans]|uniref:Uncharacterized protein n=1 Tax=Symbiodinium natans TaxID=878477 RepID=A0A812SUB3_9DINO|nr:unnamed protein product [Symbiodinium natans]
MTWIVEITSASVAALVIVVITAAVERFGGVVGGVLGTVPHVAVVASVGFILQTTRRVDFEIAMLGMPLGMLSNSLLCSILRLVTSWPRLQRLLPSRSGLRMAVAMVIGLSCYAASVALAILGFKPDTRPLEVVRVVAVCAWLCELLLGLGLLQLPTSTATGKRPRSGSAILAGRGAATFCVFLSAMLLADSVPALAGIIANVPIVSVAVIMILWMSQGEDVAMGCLAPMVLGMLSPSAYAMLASQLMLLWHPAVGAVFRLQLACP